MSTELFKGASLCPLSKEFPESRIKYGVPNGTGLRLRGVITLSFLRFVFHFQVVVWKFASSHSGFAQILDYYRQPSGIDRPKPPRDSP
jgi:hypothetical protein